MNSLSIFNLSSAGWGQTMLLAVKTTILVSCFGFIAGVGIGALIAWGKIQGGAAIRAIGTLYTTLLRGVPALLVIYLIYFGGSSALDSLVRHLSGASVFVGLPPFPTGIVALAVISGAYTAEILRGAYLAIPKGQFEAAHAMGLSQWRIMRLVTFPLTMRYALPGLGNVWQMVLKESALISVIGLIDIMGEAQIGAGSTYEPFVFFVTAGVLYLAISSVSNSIFHVCERWTLRGVRAR